MEQTNITKKSVKRDARRVGLAELCYTLILLVLSFLLATVGFAQFAANAPNKKSHDALAAEFGDLMLNSGTLMIVSCLVGLVFLFLFFRKEGTHKELFKKEKSMTLPHFGALLCIFFLFSTIGDTIFCSMETDLNSIGFTSTAIIEQMNIRGSASMYLYACFLGPIIEELVYRGFLMRPLQKHGKAVAIVATSILFGMMHANLPQMICGMLVGLVLGYVATEYSIIWSIVLHIFNNFIMCDLVTEAISNSSTVVQLLVMRGFGLMTAFMALVVIIRKRHSIAAWCRDAFREKTRMLWVMTSVGMMLPLAYHFYEAVSFLERI